MPLNNNYIFELDADFSIDAALEFDIEFEEDSDIVFEIKEQFVIEYKEKLPDYEGPYNVIPKISKTILPTKDTSMSEDITIFQIPYAAVKNTAGGVTVTIGLE